jgi:hypothetical protein
MDEMREQDFTVDPRPSIDDLLDLLPEFCEYRDDGCDAAAAGLECPFPRCLQEIKGATQKWMTQLRDREIARRHSCGEEVALLSKKFGVCARTIERIVKTSRT